MTHRSKTVTTVIGAVIALAGAIVSIVHFFQPWRTCPYDDSSAACSMLPADAAVMATALLGVLVGLLILSVGVFAKRADVAR